MLKADKTLDVQSVSDTKAGLRAAEQTLNAMQPGQVLKVILPGRQATPAFTLLADRLGCRVEEAEEQSEHVVIVFRKQPA